MHSKSWDDIRFVLAVIDTGTVSGAARLLNVNHATVLRRISSFEQRHNVQIFAKTAQGYDILPENLRLVEALRAVAESVDFVQATLAGQTSSMAANLRLTSTDTLCCYLLPSVIERISARLPDLNVSMLSTNARLDLGRSQVDLAVRVTQRMTEDLSGILAGQIEFGFYGAAGAADSWIGLLGDVGRAPVGQSYAAFLKGRRVTARVDTFTVAAHMALRGSGRVLLPNFVAAQFPDLQRVTEHDAPFQVPCWVACHADMADVPRVKRLRRLLAETLKETLEKLSA